jgi:multimeric flavodoxin WrbA
MKILGINGSPRKTGTTGKLITEILNATGQDTELIHLGGKHISPCMECLGCAKDNICKLKDDMQGMRDQIISADALIVGGANYYGMMNGLVHCFLERFYQFRHMDKSPVKGKPFVAVGTGGNSGEPAAANIRAILEYNGLVHVDTITVNGVAPCYTCGLGEDCDLSAVQKRHGVGTKISDEITPSLEKQPEVVDKAREIGLKLAKVFQ